MHPPLYIKYRTESDRRYLYDLGTGRILEVDDTVYAIIDDYRMLSHEEIVQKHSGLGVEAVEKALSDLDAVRKDGYLADHEPQEPAKVERVWFEKKLYELDDFWGRMASLLILGITERCNLCCDYCCYSGKFVGHRPHRNRSMPRKIAEKAIVDYLGNEPASDGDFYPVTFYGGEPLLEFGLMKEIVEFADDLAQKHGKWFRYAITTNGTLLDDEATDFLVAHNFMVIVSFDGPKKSHDRYRKFRNGDGSFDLVTKNLKRFAERHPDYLNRGVNMVMAPPLELEAASAVMNDLYADFPLSRASIVNTGFESRFIDEPAAPTRYGCYSACSNVTPLANFQGSRRQPNAANLGRRRSPNAAVGDSRPEAGQVVEYNDRAFGERPLPEKERPLPDDSGLHDGFRYFSEADRKQMNAMWNETTENLKQQGIAATKQKMPLATMLVEQQIGVYHRRFVADKKPEFPLVVPCFPGFTRRFCDVEGNYRICERVDDSKAFIIGNVWTGPDAEQLNRTMELRRHFGDCANCTAIKTCDICYARIPESDHAATGFDPLYDLQCQRTRGAAASMLKIYTEIMESNPAAFDWAEDGPPSRTESLRYGVVPRPLTAAEVEKMRCERLPQR